MALRFKCTYCSEEVIVEWLNVGERAECYAFKRKSLIPENAVEIKSVNETRHQELQKIAKKLRKQVVVDDLIFNSDYKNKTAEKVWNDRAQFVCSICDNHAGYKTAKCSNCGAIFQQPGSEDKENPDLICSACNFVQKNSTATFCINCGAALFPKKKVKVNECPTCKTHYEISDKFCDKDGNKLKIIEVEEGSEFQVSDIKSEELDKEIVETVSTDKVQEEQTELGFGWGIFWIVACILQGIVLLFYSIYGLNEYLINPGYAIVIFAISCLAFASGYLVFQRKISGLYLTYFIVIVNYGIGGLGYLVDFLNNGEIGSGLRAVALMLFGGFWWFYFNKRKEMFS